MDNGHRPEGPVTQNGQDDPHYSVAVAASMAGVAEETIRALYDSGELTGYRDHRGHRMINGGSLRRRMLSVGVSEAARIAEVSPATIRAWYDAGYLTGYKTSAGRRRVEIASVRSHMGARKR